MGIIKRNGGLLLVYAIFFIVALVLVNDVKNDELGNTKESTKIAIKN